MGEESGLLGGEECVSLGAEERELLWGEGRVGEEEVGEERVGEEKVGELECGGCPAGVFIIYF